jgi:hypothetical protein
MRKITVSLFLGLLTLFGATSALAFGMTKTVDNTLLTTTFKIPDDKAVCTYRFFERNNKLLYVPDPISPSHCQDKVELGNSTVESIIVRIPIANVLIDGMRKTCHVQINRRAPGTPYVYSFVNSDRKCGDKVGVVLEQPK